MRTLTIGSDYIEFKPAYVTDVKQIGIFIAVIFTCVTLLALSDFGVHWGPLVALCVVCLALSLTSYDATCRIGNGNMVLERRWLRKRFLRDIRLNDFVSIKVELNISRGSHRR